jgi:hypothetical protein
MSPIKTALLCFVVWIVSALLAFAAIVLPDVVSRAGPERPQPVAFSDFLAEVDAGRVTEIHVKGRTATFRLRSDSPKISVVKEAVGPFDDEPAIRALRPTRPDDPPPTVSFEK